MKKLEPITIDGHIVEIEAHRKEGGILFAAICGDVRREGFMTMHPNSSRTMQQHQADVKLHVEKLAQEAAGHHQNESLLNDFFADDKQ
jgi:hypothetical protein